MQTWRTLLAASAVLFLIGVAAQFLSIGLALTRLGGNGDAGLHINVGYWLPILPLLTLILCWPARAGGRSAILAAVVFVDTFVQGILPVLRSDAPFVAALHPLNALVIAALGGILARRAIALARAQARAPAEAQQPSTSTQPQA